MRPHQFAGAGSRRRQGGPQQSSSLRLKSRNASRFRSLKKETEERGGVIPRGRPCEGRWFWYDEVPSGRLGKWEMVVRTGVGLAGATRSGGEGEATLKQELVASSAGNNMHAVRSTYWKVPTRGPFACATACYEDVPWLSTCTLHLAPCTCFSHFVTSLPGTRHVDRKKKRGWMRLPGMRLGRICIGGCHCLKRTPSPSLSAPSFLLIKPLLPKQKNKEKKCTQRENGRPFRHSKQGKLLTPCNLRPAA